MKSNLLTLILADIKKVIENQMWQTRPTYSANTTALQRTRQVKFLCLVCGEGSTWNYFFNLRSNIRDVSRDTEIKKVYANCIRG